MEDILQKVPNVEKQEMKVWWPHRTDVGAATAACPNFKTFSDRSLN